MKCFPEQKYLTLHGAGEPLLDQEMHLKVSVAKDLGYRGIGFATNCTELTQSTAEKLLNAGLDTIIYSIDGFKKETHESIRIGTSFDKIVANVLKFIEMRNERTAKTRVLVRFIRQPSNWHEWEEYRNCWQNHLDSSVGDAVLRFDVHNWGGDRANERREETEPEHFEQYCDDLVNRMVIDPSGRLALCCGVYKGPLCMIGNVFTDDPVELYNRPPFTVYREAMKQGKLRDLKLCSECDILINRQTRIVPETLNE